MLHWGLDCHVLCSRELEPSVKRPSIPLTVAHGRSTCWFYCTHTWSMVSSALSSVTFTAQWWITAVLVTSAVDGFAFHLSCTIKKKPHLWCVFNSPAVVLIWIWNSSPAEEVSLQFSSGMWILPLKQTGRDISDHSLFSLLHRKQEAVQEVCVVCRYCLFLWPLCSESDSAWFSLILRGISWYLGIVFPLLRFCMWLKSVVVSCLSLLWNSVFFKWMSFSLILYRQIKILFILFFFLCLWGFLGSAVGHVVTSLSPYCVLSVEEGIINMLIVTCLLDKRCELYTQCWEMWMKTLITWCIFIIRCENTFMESWHWFNAADKMIRSGTCAPLGFVMPLAIYCISHNVNKMFQFQAEVEFNHLNFINSKNKNSLTALSNRNKSCENKSRPVSLSVVSKYRSESLTWGSRCGCGCCFLFCFIWHCE